MCWEKLAKEVEANYESIVNWKERFFICPHCGEPVLLEDWPKHDWEICPICNFDFFL